MPDVNFETCETEDLIGGTVKTTDVDIADGTYYRGQALGMVSATSVYGPFDSGVTTGLENARAVIVEDVVVSGGSGRAQVFTAGSELQKRGIKDASGDPITLTQALIENFRTNSIILKN